jgi:hypothetical protein
MTLTFAKFGDDWVIFVNLTFDLNDLDLCQIWLLTGTPELEYTCVQNFVTIRSFFTFAES